MEKRCFGCMQLKTKSPICEHCGFNETKGNHDHQLPLGTVVGQQYILGRVLGQGGFGITYLGWDMVMNQRVAVKEYFPKGYASRTSTSPRVTSYDGQNSHDFEYNKQRFLREAESLAALWNVPQIVRILRHFEDNGTAYIAMEYAEGMDLRAYLKKRGRPMTVQETLDILGPVMEALKAVHNANLVHRDISPDNIMVLPDGSAKLLDFGAARFVQNANAEQDRQTSTQAILKDGFAPPEQYRTHGALGPWTDEYAMCATIYYCLTGKIPPEAMARTVDEEDVDWSKVRGLSPKQKAALEKGMALQAKNRFPSVAELWEQLKPFPIHGDPMPPEEKPSTPVRKPEQKQRSGAKRILPAAAAAVVLAAVSLLIPKKEPSVSTPPGSAAPDTIVESTVTEPTVNSTETRPDSVQANVKCTFEENDTGLTITGYVGTLPNEIILPSEYEGKPVTSIGNQAFYECITLTSVTIPDSVTVIGPNAFNGCTGLTSISIPNSVTSIGNSVFKGCSGLTEISISSGVTSISEDLFYNCTALTSIIIPDSITSIGRQAFYNCTNLTSITIPSNVTSIGTEAFMLCSNLTNITIPDGVTSILAYTFHSCSNLTNIIIPESVAKICAGSFYNCNMLKEVTISRDCELIDSPFPDACTIHYYDEVQPSGAYTATVTASELAVFNAPSNGASKIASLTQGQQVTIHRTVFVADIEWGFTDYGWILMQYVK